VASWDHIELSDDVRVKRFHDRLRHPILSRGHDERQRGRCAFVMMTRDRLLLLRPGFEDPAFPGQRFYCWH